MKITPLGLCLFQCAFGKTQVIKFKLWSGVLNSIKFLHSLHFHKNLILHGLGGTENAQIILFNFGDFDLVCLLLKMKGGKIYFKIYKKKNKKNFCVFVNRYDKFHPKTSSSYYMSSYYQKSITETCHENTMK